VVVLDRIGQRTLAWAELHAKRNLHHLPRNQ
jgi:hypothetical protein